MLFKATNKHHTKQFMDLQYKGFVC